MINILIYQTLALTIHRKIIQINKFKTSAPTCNEEFELPGESYSLLDIQDYLEYILKQTWKEE